MLNIIKSGFTTGGQERIKKDILERTLRGERVLLIVPEQQTVMAEAEMADLLPPSSVLTFEVTNFTRLANSTARALGGISGEYCDNTKRSLLMWRALAELSPLLSHSTGINEGLVKRYLNASSSLDGLGITADDLTRAASSELITDNRLRSKLSDLSLVHSLHKRLMEEKYGSSEDDVGRMLRKLKENPEYLSGTTVFVEGFTSFTKVQLSLISELAGRLDLTVLLCISHASGDSFEYTEVRHTLEKLKRAAFMPASINRARLSSVSTAGPTVQIIFVFLILLPPERVSPFNLLFFSLLNYTSFAFDLEGRFLFSTGKSTDILSVLFLSS